MYRLAHIENTKLQAIISKEILNAFEDTFKISSNNKEEILSNIEMFCDEMDIPMNSQLQHDLLLQ